MRNYFLKRPSGAPLLCQNYIMFPLVLYPSPYFEAVNCFIYGRRRVAVARYRMICLVLVLLFIKSPCKCWTLETNFSKLFQINHNFQDFPTDRSCYILTCNDINYFHINHNHLFFRDVPLQGLRHFISPLKPKQLLSVYGFPTDPIFYPRP